MKKLSMCAVLFIAALCAFAQQKPVVVVAPFEGNGLSREDMETMSDVFTSEYANTGRATVVDRSSLDKIQQQLEFQSSDWSDTAKVAELGRALNASQVVVGQVRNFNGQLLVNIKLIDVNTTSILAAVTPRYKDMLAFFDAIPQLCNELTLVSSGQKISATQAMVTEKYWGTKKKAVFWTGIGCLSAGIVSMCFLDVAPSLAIIGGSTFLVTGATLTIVGAALPRERGIKQARIDNANFFQNAQLAIAPQAMAISYTLHF
ncbi:MAG: hypothetical protein J6I73_05255 [Treponema sp.]|nr:hypothetical protein [Treponema sp.]